MSVKTTYVQDERIGQILDIILKFVQSDFKARGNISGTGDELDAIIIGLNTLGEELEAKTFFVEENKKRINGIMDALLKYTLMDFSEKIPVTEKGDELDAIIVGLNTLSEELESNMRQLKESEERFRSMVEGTKDYAIFMIDINGYIMNWNKGAEHIKGYSSDEIIGKHISTFYTEDEIANNEPEYNLTIAAQNGHHETQGWRVRKNGTRFWADIVFSALYDEKKKLTGFSKITRDVTEKKNFEDAIQKKSEELSRSNKELEQFAYVASHDLQEPLRMVSSFLQLLEKQLDGKLDKDSKEYIDFAVDGAMRMKNMINDLLSYSRILSKKAKFEKTDLQDILLDVKSNLKESIDESKANIIYGKMPVLTVDRIKVTRLFQNLIANAIKFIEKNSTPVIEVNCKEQPDAYLFSVKDNGIGMKKEYHDKIFLIFQRLNSKEQYAGTGIGLAECQKIAELHEGKIWVESEPGKGATFFFTIKKYLS